MSASPKSRFTTLEAYDGQLNVPATVVRHETELTIRWPSNDVLFRTGIWIGAGVCCGTALVLSAAIGLTALWRVVLP